MSSPTVWKRVVTRASYSESSNPYPNLDQSAVELITSETVVPSYFAVETELLKAEVSCWSVAFDTFLSSVKAESISVIVDNN